MPAELQYLVFGRFGDKNGIRFKNCDHGVIYWKHRFDQMYYVEICISLSHTVSGIFIKNERNILKF